MTNQKRGGWKGKAKRTLTCLLPVADNRQGKCADCGACCKLPNICPFLKFKKDGSSYCSIHSLRPLNCRKYPRASDECVTKDTCGFKFN
jgi:hypothetical protein